MTIKDGLIPMLPHADGAGYKFKFNSLGMYTNEGKTLCKPGPEAKRIYWYTCRETFHDSADIRLQPPAVPADAPELERLLTRAYFFGIPSNKELDVVELIERVEEHLALPTRSEFQMCQLNGTNKEDSTALYVRPSDFWWEDKMRHQLFSILLRSGNLYNRQANPQPALMDACCLYSYAQLTRPAVEHFMKGNTRYVGNVWSKGWRSVFAAEFRGNGRAISPAELEMVLVKPENVPANVPVTLPLE